MKKVTYLKFNTDYSIQLAYHNKSTLSFNLCMVTKNYRIGRLITCTCGYSLYRIFSFFIVSEVTSRIRSS